MARTRKRRRPVMRQKTGPQVKLDSLLNLFDFERAAGACMTPEAHAYIAGAAADEITLRWNREALDGIALRPRVLVDVSKIDTGLKLLGEELPHPILLAPAASHRIVHGKGELATAQGAAAAQAVLIVSSAATASFEEIAEASSGRLWFQLYVQKDRGFTRALVERVVAHGCRALCLTVDTPVIGIRDREVRAGFALPPGLEHPNLKGSFPEGLRAEHRPTDPMGIYSPALDPSLTWTDLAWLKSLAKVPLVIKGILDPEDAARAASEGADGIIVSNHGARNLDTAVATADALPAIVEKVAGRIPVLVDGGIRRGTDVVKLLALGASAVLIGRPYLYGLAVAGADGVARVVQLLRRELEMAMALTGRASLGAIDGSVVLRR
ncbi:MAG: alpha-hydroxy acid oxidase [Terriglobales bacterium]